MPQKHRAARGKSGNQRFASIPSVSLPRSAFDRSRRHLTTMDAGYLVPFYKDEALPGDTVSVRLSSFARMLTPEVPVMDTMHLDVFFFAVPMRLLWDNWQKFNGEQANPGDSTDFLTPKSTSPVGGYDFNSLQDYLNIPPGVAGLEHNVFFMRAYNLIWNEWFRSEDIQDSVQVPLDDGPDDPADFVLLRRGKRHDYFTASLPFQQKGPAVELPLGSQAPLVGFPAFLTASTAPTFLAEDGGTTGALTAATVGSFGGVNFAGDPAGGNLNQELEWDDPALIVDLATGAGVSPDPYADLSAATAATLTSIREAATLQQLLERDARGGTRYTEIIRAHFGVISPDARLQRPEYLGGGSSVIHIHPVAQTSETSGTPQGNLAAFATGGNQGEGFTQSFTEHCVVLGMAMIRADLTYQQGLERSYSRSTRYDYFWPDFQHLSEQEVLSKEIFADGGAGDDDVFGYQERYAEYRYAENQISGTFRSSHPQSLDIWHLAQAFSTRPVLNNDFIEEDPPIDRVITVQNEPQFKFDSWLRVNAVRPMAAYGTPGLKRF